MRAGRLSVGSLLTMALLAMALVACATPRDDLTQARDSLGRGDLLATIVSLDRVPPADPNYAEARSLARAVERRMRTGQRMFSRGLMLRAEWRDEAAIEAFELAQQVWPCIDGVDLMIEATRRRIDSLTPGGQVDVSKLPDSAVATTEPIEVGLQPPDPEFEAGDMIVTEIWSEYMAFDDVAMTSLGMSSRSSGEDARDPQPVEEPTGVVTPEQLRRVQLDAAAADLADGRLDAALDRLESMFFREPQADEVRVMLARVLHQRALMFYGKGQLQAAIDGWGRILQIDPEHDQAREFFQAAETELRSLRAAAPM